MSYDSENMENTSSVSGDQLRSYIERIESLEEEKQNTTNNIKDVYAEAKLSGFDAKILRQIIRLRKQEPQEREEQEVLLDIYLRALGMAVSPAETVC